MKLRAKALRAVVGMVWGLYVFLATFWLLWFRDGAGMATFTHLYSGYATTYLSLTSVAIVLFLRYIPGVLSQQRSSS